MFAAVFVLAVAAPGDTHTLKWKLDEGDVFYNKVTVEMDQTIEFLGQKIDQKVTMKTVLKFKVKSVTGDTRVVEMTYLEHTTDSGLPGFNVGDKLKGVTFTATLDKNLKVTKLDGYDKFLAALAGEDAEQKALMKALVPETSIRQLPAQMFSVNPGRPVAVGGGWEAEERTALGGLGSLETKQAFTLDGVKDGVAAVSEKADLTFKPGGGDTGLPFKITKADLKVEKYAGTHKFDIKAGRATDTKVDMTMGGTMTLSTAGTDIDARLSIRMTTVGVISEKNPAAD